MKVKLTILESRCRDGLCKAGDTYLVDSICPPLCHELWSVLYPLVTSMNGHIRCSSDGSTYTAFIVDFRLHRKQA